MAYEKTTWVDGETEIDANKLNKIEDGIVEASKTGGILAGTIVGYDGDTIPEGYEEVENPNVYSTEEKVIGEWLGKPIYRKVVDVGYLPNAGAKFVNHEISNIDSFVTIRGIATNGTNFFPLPYSYSSPSSNAGQYSITLYSNKLQIAIETGSDRTSYSAKVILEYTKTTD